MINKINKIKTNPKLMETFFNLNGRNTYDDEIEILQQNIDTETNSIINSVVTDI